MQGFNSLLMLFGRIGLAAIFLLSGSHKLINFDLVQKFLADKGFQYVPFFVIAAALIELIGGLSLLLGWKTRWGALLLFLYLIPVTLIIHNFWDVKEAQAHNLQMIMFLKNLAIMGGLLYVLSFAAGSFSIDRFSKKKDHN